MFIGLLVQVTQIQVQANYIALPGLPRFADSSGKPITSQRLWFHPLTFLKTERGFQFFRLDGGPVIHGKLGLSNIANQLVPLLDTPLSRQIKAKYQGKKVWFYGGQGLYIGKSTMQEIPFSAAVQVAFAGEVAGQDIPKWMRDHSSSTGNGVSYLGRKSNQNYLFFRFAYRNMAKAGTDYSGMESAETTALMNHHRYASDGSLFFSPDTPLNQIFSLTAPGRAALQTQKHAPQYLDMGDVTRYLKGRTHWQIAWVYGFPLDGKPLAETLKEKNWHCGCCWEFEFKNDRVIRAYEEMSH